MLKGKVAIVGGASKGLGRACAQALAEEGASVMLCSRSQTDIEKAAREIRDVTGTLAAAFAGDLEHPEAIRALFAATVERFGRLDVMMCNAGFGIYGAIDDITPDQMKKLMDVNYFGTYYAARAALPVFRRQQAGHLIVVSSIAGKRGVPYMGAYSATKFAQIGMAECLRSEVYGSGIHVSVLCPISTPTEFTEVLARETGGEVTASLGPQQSAEAVAEAVARAIERPVPEIYPYFKSRGLVLLNAIAPGLTDKIVQRFGRKPVRGATLSGSPSDRG